MVVRNKIDLSFLIGFIVVFFLVISTIVVSANSNEGYISITIADGDTLWDIAREYEGLYQMSSVQFINWVASNNDINKNVILPGQEITIPVKQDRR
jgi:LysM repeat protein